MIQMRQTLSCSRRGALGLLLALICWLTWPGASLADLDICGCVGDSRNLGNFDSHNAATFPPGTTRPVYYQIAIPLPADGTLVFSSFTVGLTPEGYGAEVLFFHLPNPANGNRVENTPVTLLVTGNVTINAGSATGRSIIVLGNAGASGSNGVNGVGGMGGPGGFQGGAGAYQLVNLANNGGSGIGPGGGSGGTASPLTHGGPATFVGVPQLLPLVGGSGGGGGASTNNSLGCSGGGGGGGGGAIVIAANGTITVNGNIVADGANGGSRGSSTCASSGHGGSGGAIRLLANTITGSGALYARGGTNPSTGAGAGAGAIRLEALNNNMSATSTDPVATRAPAPGPVTNPLTSTVEIITVNGLSVPAPAQGFRGVVDVILPAPGPVTVVLQTMGVPTGTGVNVTAKPQVGGAPITQTATLAPGSCDTFGTCAATVTFASLQSGAFFIEAQATFVVP